MGIGRHLVSFAAGGVAIYLLSRTAASPSVQDIDVSTSARQNLSTIEGSRIPVEIVSRSELKAPIPAEPKTVQPPAVPPAENQQVPPLPDPVQLRARMARLGIPEGQAEQALQSFGSVKVNAIVEREEQRRLQAIQEGRQLAIESEAGQPSSSTEARSAETDDPYEVLREQLSASPLPSEDELNEYRRHRFHQYVETVKSSENATRQSNSGGLPCTGLNCSSQ